MSESRIYIVELPPSRVASVHAYGPSPESSAWEKLVAWAEPQGLLEEREAHRIFGFDNPSPSAGSPNYGYEFWIVVGPDVEPEGEIKIVEFSGGRYAVARCETRGNLEKIGETWKALVAWREGGGYGQAHHQWLEEFIGYTDEAEKEIILDMHLPIAG
jgi:DNA gyrase inhibitor GyrI